jgi:hypothetical protein
MGNFIFGFIIGAVSFTVIFNFIHVRVVKKLEWRLSNLSEAVFQALKKAVQEKEKK